MASSTTLTCSSFLGEPISSASSSSKPLSGATHLRFSPPPGNQCSHRCFLVFSRKLSGLEEAMRIRRERELQSSGKVRRRPPLRRGKVSARLPVPENIPKPPYVNSSSLPDLSKEPQIHDAEGIARMKAACELAARVLEYAGTLVRPSITTNEIDKAVHKMIIDAGAYPSPLGYGGFPKSVCTSVNECMCHGIPDSRQLQGYHGDTSKTFLCGKVDEQTERLVRVTEECMNRAISACKDGANFRKIGKKISYHAERYGYGVAECFVGHGVGTVFHSEPLILHFQPILTMGSIESITWDDNWTTLTADGSPAAQFEHTILITRTGAEILTKC
ncbi:hypothetical protein AMTRI_Chr12g235060 [Amborella trichopoda]